MGKRSLKQKPTRRIGGKRVTAIASGLLALVLIGGPSALHFIWGMTVSPVLTASMAPFAEPGDLLISMPTEASTLTVGDVISIHNLDSDTYYAHRIVEVRDQGSMLRLITKGDANPTPEQDPLLVAPEVTIHREVMNVKWLGTPLVYINSDQGRLASVSLLVIANLALIAYFLQKKTKKAGMGNE